MKSIISFLLLLLSMGFASFAQADYCMRAAESAAWKKWYKPTSQYVGNVMGGTKIVWKRGNVTSYQVSIEYHRLGSTGTNYANYSVRVRRNGSSCKAIKVRKF